jgi:hypothetical protein
MARIGQKYYFSIIEIKAMRRTKQLAFGAKSESLDSVS